jgi:hypothetical protein
MIKDGTSVRGESLDPSRERGTRVPGIPSHRVQGATVRILDFRRYTMPL